MRPRGATTESQRQLARQKRARHQPRGRTGRRDVSSRRSTSPAARSCRGMGVTVALPFLDAMVPAGTRAGARRPPRQDALRRRSRWCTARPGSTAFGTQEEPVVAGGGRPRLRPVAEQPGAARAVPRPPDDRQQHRRAQRRGVHAAGNRRRSLPLERGVPDAVAPEADAGLGRARRHLARSALRAEVRPGHADSVDAAVHRERRSGRRLLLRLLLRLHRLDQLGVADRAAADDPRPARGVRSAVRRRRHAGRARASAAPRTRASSTGSTASGAAEARTSAPPTARA